MTPDWLVLGGAMLAGLLGGAHCVAMCGGIATGFSVGSRGWWMALQPNLGRVAGYVLAAILALVVSCVVLYWLLNLAERHDGYNGDFMGAGIVLVELGALLAFAVG